MPNRKTHEKICRLLLGDPCSKTNRLIDYPSKFVKGRKHREYFHDYASAGLIGLAADGKKGLAAAILHIVTDESVSQIKKSLRKK